MAREVGIISEKPSVSKSDRLVACCDLSVFP